MRKMWAMLVVLGLLVVVAPGQASGQRSEVRGQRSEVRGQRSEVTVQGGAIRWIQPLCGDPQDGHCGR